MSGFNFDEAYDRLSNGVPIGESHKDPARALVTEALEAAADVLGSAPAYPSILRDRIRALIPKPPAPLDPMAEYVKRLEEALAASPCNCGHAKDAYHKDWCFEQRAYEVLASKPKEAKP